MNDLINIPTSVTSLISYRDFSLALFKMAALIKEYEHLYAKIEELTTKADSVMVQIDSTRETLFSHRDQVWEEITKALPPLEVGKVWELVKQDGKLYVQSVPLNEAVSLKEFSDLITSISKKDSGPDSVINALNKLFKSEV